MRIQCLSYPFHRTMEDPASAIVYIKRGIIYRISNRQLYICTTTWHGSRGRVEEAHNLPPSSDYHAAHALPVCHDPCLHMGVESTQVQLTCAIVSHTIPDSGHRAHALGLCHMPLVVRS